MHAETIPLPFTQIKGFTGRAAKAAGDGLLLYTIWLNANAKIFVRIEGNDIETKSPGSFPSLVYSVESLINGEIIGCDIDDGKMKVSKDRNVKGFLVAIVNDLMGTKVITSV